LKEPRVADACGLTLAMPTSNQAPPDAGRRRRLNRR
jgi:hypothetical protein